MKKNPAMTIDLPSDLVDAICRYLDTDWTQQPSNIGALNAVARIGERVAAIVAIARPRIPEETKADTDANEGRIAR